MENNVETTMNFEVYTGVAMRELRNGKEHDNYHDFWVL